MAVTRKTASRILSRILGGASAEERAAELGPKPVKEFPLPPRIPAGNDHTQEGLDKRRAMLAEQGISMEHLAIDHADLQPDSLSGNIENLVGYARVPVGVIGPLRINGTAANGDFYVPLATSEGALVASYNRGAYMVSQCGGASVLSLTECVGRAPCFMFENLSEAALFLSWLLQREEDLQEQVSKTSRYCKLIDFRAAITGKEVYVCFEYTTGDAAGQNMVTLATNAICEHLIELAPVKPQRWYLEGNMSGDKKATMLAFMSARGKKVIAEATIAPDILKRFAHCTPEEMISYWGISVMGGMQSGSIGVQGHFANALAALFIACGQDAACVSEASVGLTRMDITASGDLYVSVSLPNLVVGSVGGGTGLPTAQDCLSMIGCTGENGARKLSEICAATALAGEISIIAALASGEFAAAHAGYGRSRHDG